MGELSYSSGALNTLASFHRTKYVIYVEGKDDVPFWRTILSQFKLQDFVIKVAGGKNEIAKYEQTILEDDTDIIIAKDSDYDGLFGEIYDHVRIIYTYGYSIENSLYLASSIAHSISIHSRAGDTNIDSVREWQDSLQAVFEALLAVDIANELFGKGLSVMGDNCTRFLKSSKSYNPCPVKTKDYIRSLQKVFTKEELDAANKLINESGKPIWFIIRGHFLTNAVINFIKSKSKLGSMSHEMLYGEMISHLASVDDSQPDILHLRKQVDQLIAQ